MRRPIKILSTWSLIILSLLVPFLLQAQNDTTRRQNLDSFLLNQKGIIGQIAQNLFVDTTEERITSGLQRGDKRFQRYRDRIIRHIIIRRVEFGTPINDTAQSFKSKLTRMADYLHHNTRNYVIRKNLFFNEGDKLSPYLLADNERHLRDQDFLQDAKITTKTVKGSRDSIDIIVLVKDVLSIGGSFRMHNLTSATVKLKEDNLAGMGDRIVVSTLYDQRRRTKVGTGLEYAARNIAGSFIDGYAGVLNFSDAFNSRRNEEASAYVRFIRPLVNPYTRWTYAVEGSVHQTKNMYVNDSLFRSDFQYKYNDFDAWAAWNMSADKIAGANEDDRLRRVISMRYFHQNFQQIPLKYQDRYYYDYTDFSGLLGAISFFKQNFFKTQYIYGFGRNEDVPEGADISLNAGWTKKSNRERPYMDISYQRYFFTGKESYFNYTARVGSYFYQKKLQDVNALFNVDYFSRLKSLNTLWKMRNFISVGIAKQFKEELNEPLFLESEYGLPEYRNNRDISGDIRATVKAESVFYTPWKLFLFRFAPFGFGNLSWIRPMPGSLIDRKVYSSVGAGVRTRNESLVFGTIELKGYYFPNRNYYNESWRIEFNTNIKFKYNQQIIKRPELVTVN